MYESVIFLSREAMQSLNPNPDTVLISLTSPNDPARIASGWRSVLQLEFDDLCEVVMGVPVGSVPDADSDGYLVREFFGAVYRLPDARHAKAIADFLIQHEGGAATL